MVALFLCLMEVANYLIYSKMFRGINNEILVLNHNLPLVVTEKLKQKIYAVRDISFDQSFIDLQCAQQLTAMWQQSSNKHQ